MKTKVLLSAGILAVAVLACPPNEKEANSKINAAALTATSTAVAPAAPTADATAPSASAATAEATAENTANATAPADADIPIDASHFPDAIFRDYISTFDLNRDQKFSQYELNKVTEINCSLMQISSVKGIEYFPNLVDLNVHRNNIKELDVSGFPRLKKLVVGDNIDIKKLDISHNPALRELQIERAGISQLDVSHNPSLSVLWIGQADISELDLSRNTKLEDLMCTQTKVGKLDLSVCPNLKYLMCSENPNITSLDVSRNLMLESLNIGKTPIKKLDVSKNEKLTFLRIGQCDFTELDISKILRLETLTLEDTKFKSIDLSNNSKLKSLNLTHLPLKQLDLKGCPDLETLILEDFDQLKFDLSEVPQLTTLVCTNMGLDALDVSPCTYLTSLCCDVNRLTTLDLSHNTRLTYLDCSRNKLTDLDLTSNSVITHVICSQNELTEFRFANPWIEYLNCTCNHIKSIDLSDSPNLKQVYLAGNELTSVDFSQNTNLFSADVRCNRIPTPPVLSDGSETEYFPQMFHLKVDNLHLASRNQSEITLSWNELSEDFAFAYFEVWRSTSSDDGFARIGKTDTMTFSYKDKTAQNGVTYYYKLLFMYDLGNGDTVTGPFSSVLKVDASAKGEEGTFDEFIERLYTVAMNRASDPEGKKFWIDQVVNQGKTGADCARYFLLTAPEFMQRNLSVEDFVETLYKTFFDRESDAAGKKGWVEAISSGKKSRIDVVNDFIESTEWCNVCATYGVKSGAQWHKATKASKNATNFATRLYTCCLKRAAEQGGLSYWSLALTNLEKTGAQAAQFFFEGEEFVGLNTSDREYLIRLYTTFMDREPSEEEIGFWTGEMKAGKQNRHSILAFFAQSKEFTSICKKYGIERGEIG